MTLLKTLFVVFPDVALRAHEIGRFRGFLNQQIRWEDNLFHNHTEQPNGVLYRYPRIQYRVSQGRAALFGIQEGFDALQHFLSRYLDDLPEAFGNNNRMEQRTRLELAETNHTYTLHQWLGLNTIRNRDGSVVNLDTIWQEQPNVSEQQAMLERILTAQLLKFCGEMGCQLPKGQLQVRILTAEDTGMRRLSSQTGQTQMRSFRIQYSTNLQLPDYIGLGKGISKGYGWQMQDRPR